MASLFSLSILALALVISTNSVIGTPDSIKAALRESDVYPVLSSRIVESFANKAQEMPETKLNQKAIDDAFAKTITPSLVQNNVENIISGMYSWLDGSTSTPTFNVNVGDIQQQIINNLGDASVTRLKGLPACTVEQLQQLDANNVDPFTIPCNPPGLDLAQLRKQFQAQVDTSGNTKSNDSTNISADKMVNSAGQNVFSQADYVPKLFQLGQKLPWIFGLMAILSSVAIVYFNKPRKQGIQSIAIMAIVAGILLLLLVTITTVALRYLGNNAPGIAVEVAMSTINTLYRQMAISLKVFASSYILLGLVGLITIRFIKPPGQNTDALPLTSDTTAADTSISGSNQSSHIPPL